MGANQSAEVFDTSKVASADLSAKQYFAVKLHTTEDQIALGAAVTDVCLGILQDKPKSGEAGRVRVLGVSKAVTDGSGTAITIGDKLGTNASGKLVKAHTPDRPIVGTALAASSADGTIIPVLLTPNAVFRTPA
jgi:hypothetical protein